ncbi:MAG: NAD-dependent epimerase/dehydratase family protein [Oscillospiraceae bacterium]|nr:NAD-dependent epimerase/dehydratase family protein [Oscillospiraceae bacterium]
MFQRYYITGATGFIGRTVTAELAAKGAEICALVLENDALACRLPDEARVFYGDVCDDRSLRRFFSEADENSCVIHCAGIVSVASDPGGVIYRVNAAGTNNVLRHCELAGVGKLVYVSSVHAIPEKPKGKEITEQAVFSPELVKGDYAKSKAIATALVFEAAERGLNASVVFPSGVIGPGDRGKGSITSMLLSFIAGKLPFAVKGGYDFVDVRDVASGIIACAERGLPGHGYILSGQYSTIRGLLSAAKKELKIKRAVSFLPLSLAKLAAPRFERRSLRKKQPLCFTPYSVAVLESNSRFSRKAAEAALDYAPRSVESSVRDTVRWLKSRCFGRQDGS